MFYRLVPRRKIKDNSLVNSESDMSRFVSMKKFIAVLLVPVLLGLALYSFVDWFMENFISINKAVDSIKNVNNIFFDEFFTVLILTDVLLLLFSLIHTDQFNKVIRNSGFILSTILIRFSFGVDGLLNSILLLSAVLFGVAILSIHNQYEKILIPDGAEEE